MGVFIGEYSLLDLLVFPTSLFILLVTLYDLPYVLPILAIIFVVLTLYSLRFKLTISEIVRSLLFSMLHLFFREVATRGSHHIPETGPVLLACAPHANQFVDPICVMSITSRFVRFLCAAWSMRQPYIGDIARALKAIPVERAVDIAKKGEGKVTIKGTEVIGDDDTQFTQYSPGYSFLIKDEQYTIATIENDHHMTLTHAPDQSTTDAKKPRSYSCAPRIDQSSVFTHVWDALGAGEVVGIFPEGLSHDQSSLLPIKAGVAVMALGACAKHEGLPLKIIPVGLNYFQGSKFRSRVYLDIAAGITPTKSQIDGYRAGGEAKQAAINELLEHVRTSLKLVTATAPSHRILHLFWAVRRLYTPDNVHLSVTKKLELVRRFEKYWSALQDEPEAIELASRVEAYNEKLLALGIRDSEVKVATSNPHYVFPMFVQRVSLLLMMAIAAFPGGLLNLPIMCASKVVSTYKAKEAVKESPDVKLKGYDVIATWKLMVAGAMLPLCWILYPIVAAIVGWHYHVGAFRCWAAVSLLQIPLMYASVRTAEVGWRMLMSLKPLWFALTGHVGMKELKEERDSLAQDIKRLVDVYGPKLWPDFEKQRVISQDRTLNKHWDAQQPQQPEAEKRLTPKSDDDFQKTHFLRFRSRKELGL